MGEDRSKPHPGLYHHICPEDRCDFVSVADDGGGAAIAGAGWEERGRVASIAASWDFVDRLRAEGRKAAEPAEREGYQRGVNAAHKAVVFMISDGAINVTAGGAIIVSDTFADLRGDYPKSLPPESETERD